MDIISHALWTNLILKDLPVEQRSLAITFSTAPDLISFSFLRIKEFLRKIIHYTDPPLNIIPLQIFHLYNLTHTLVIWGTVGMILYIVNLKLLFIAFFGWILHILFDIFTHTKNYFPTPIFWPLSNFHFSGVNWSNKYFMAINYTILLILYFIFVFN
jgi:hypothetical protein